MFKIYFIISFILKLTLQLHIKLLNKEPVELNITEININKNNVDPKVVWMYLLKYDPLDDQIESITDLEELKHVRISPIGQEILPDFKNLPKFSSISMPRNNIGFIKKEAVSTTPVEELYFDGNQIKTIENGAFGLKVTTLYISCNRLNKFSPRWFQNASSLEVLDMSGNEITNIQENAFKNFISLNQIYLSFNKITSIAPGALSNTNTFTTIYLANNLLTELNADIFRDGQIDISSIHLQNNKLTYLSNEFIRKTNRTKARIYGNPWQCACWDLLRQWNTWVNYEYNKEPAGDPRCVKPLSFHSKCIPVVESELIEYYEQNAPEKETAEMFCKTYLQ